MDKDQERIQNFEMPRATIGMPVLWYPTGRREAKTSRVAYMIHCGGRTATLQVSNGRVDAVRHVDDPKLDLSQDQREQGAWDFTYDWKELQEFKQQVNARIAELEKEVERLAAKRPVGRPPKEEQIRDPLIVELAQGAVGGSLPEPSDIKIIRQNVAVEKAS